METVFCRGVTRSWTIDFKAERKHQNEARERARERISSRFNLLVHQMEQAQKKPGQKLVRSMSGILKKDVYYDIHEAVIDLNKIPMCQLCNQTFGFMGSNKKLQCPTCRRIICSNCKNTRYFLTLPPPLKGILEICKRCRGTVRKKEEMEKFKAIVEEANQSRITLWYNTLMALKHEINKKMPPFCGLVLSLTGQVSNDGKEVSPSDIIKDMNLDTLYYLQQHATEQLKILEMHYKNFQNRMKMINSHPHTTPREENIKKLLRLAIVQFLEANLPQFNMLSSQLLKFLNSPEMMASLKNHEVKKIEAEKQEQMEKRLEEHKQLIERQQNGRTITKNYNPFAESWSDITIEPTPNQIERNCSITNSNVTNLGSNSSPNSPTIPRHSMPERGTSSTRSSTPPREHRTQRSTTSWRIIDIFAPKTIPEADGPSITLVKPVVVPTCVPAIISIQGENFKEGLSLIIGGVRIPPTSIKLVTTPGHSTIQIQVKVPVIEEPGTKPIILINPDQKTACLENVLTYIDDDTLARSFEEREKEKFYDV